MNGLLLPIVKPVTSWEIGVVLVEQAVVLFPGKLSAFVDVDPVDEVVLWELGLLAPVVDEVLHTGS